MWTYSDWVTLTDAAAQRTRLALHIQEVTDAITADVASDGKSRSSQGLVQMLARLEARLAALDEKLGYGAAATAVSLTADLRGGRR